MSRVADITNRNQKESDQLIHWPALIAFFLTGAMGPLLGWQTQDLVWGLLLTSFAACILGLILGIQSKFRLGLQRFFSEWEGNKAVILIVLIVFSGMFIAVITIIGFGIFFLHVLYVFAIYGFFPFWVETPSPFELSSEQQIKMLLLVVTQYWPFALIALVQDWRRQFRPLWSPGHFDLFRPLSRLFRMHLFLILAAAVASFAGTGHIFYWFTLFFFFFPWNTKKLRKKLKLR